MGRLYVDDERAAPDHTWVVARSSAYALYLLRSQAWDVMSLDHDLGGSDTTRRIVLWLCENPQFWPKEVLVHSANPPGREWLNGMIERYKP